MALYRGMYKMGWFTRNYTIKIKCQNCETKSLIKIPRGKTIREHLEEGRGYCDFCGCNTVGKDEKEQEE